MLKPIASEVVDTSITEARLTELLTPPSSPEPLISMNHMTPGGMYPSSDTNDEYVFTV
jgi:hypothetical protein